MISRLLHDLDRQLYLSHNWLKYGQQLTTISVVHKHDQLYISLFSLSVFHHFSLLSSIVYYDTRGLCFSKVFLKSLQ